MKRNAAGKFIPSNAPIAYLRQIGEHYFVLRMGEEKSVYSNSRARAERYARKLGYRVVSEPERCAVCAHPWLYSDHFSEWMGHPFKWEA